MKGKVEAFLSIFAKVCGGTNNPMPNVFIEYGATLIVPLELYIEKVSPLPAGATEIIQQRLSDIRQQFVEAGKESNKEGILKVFENFRRLYDDLELVLTAVEDIRKRSRPSKV